MAWLELDLTEDPDTFRFEHDPATLLEEILLRPHWHSSAACRGHGNELFFPGRGEGSEPARAICASCPVRDECLAAGMNTHQGIWGGTSERERRRLRRSTSVETAA